VPASLARKIAAAKKRGRAKIPSPQTIPFCPPERLDFRIRSPNFRQKRFEFCTMNTVKLCYSHHMATIKRNKKLENLVEQKILEFFGENYTVVL